MNPEVSRVLKNTIILLQNCQIRGGDAAALAEALDFLGKLWADGQTAPKSNEEAPG